MLDTERIFHYISFFQYVSYNEKIMEWVIGCSKLSYISTDIDICKNIDVFFLRQFWLKI